MEQFVNLQCFSIKKSSLTCFQEIFCLKVVIQVKFLEKVVFKQGAGSDQNYMIFTIKTNDLGQDWE